MTEPTSPPRVLGCEEIEMYLKGDRREIDRLILMSLNRLALALSEHSLDQDTILHDLRSIGGMQAVKDRAEFVDSLIIKNNKRSAMMEKVGQSSLVWALLAFLGFLAMASWDAIVHAAKIKLGAM